MSFFFFNDTATTEIYTLSLHDALPIFGFFRDLTARGLTGVALVTSDAHAGLVAAIGATVPGAAWQRCRTHYAANLMAVDRKSTRLNSSHANISYAVFCLKKKKNNIKT